VLAPDGNNSIVDGGDDCGHIGGGGESSREGGGDLVKMASVAAVAAPTRGTVWTNSLGLTDATAHLFSDCYSFSICAVPPPGMACI
jgi:hypothetical protein